MMNVKCYKFQASLLKLCTEVFPIPIYILLLLVFLISEVFN